MLVRTLEQAQKTPRRVTAPNWESTRLLLREDGMGYSFHITTIYPGTETHIHYKHHLETVYCLEGEGEVRTLADGQRHAIAPGVMYALDRHDEHLLRARTTMRLACVFNPALAGHETHDANGVYPLLDDEG
ncbi:Ectoine synthase [Desulfarculus baarsii DSM 2075]|uniref:L-ectoine synthase n=1 Tax=Desulfarculus baarsii (strain ATCC 33931 / DSM 2075 / LMG 7858 / VKM B-1802 / 2st14) TaxID=644282 RepID=E1QGN1_DESB2|nr:ectoine synthase [Desulfarculus baarsii]ADK84724.1 Ectoine synthase [Desulfarculus baarsii DSM 2075]